MLMEDFNKLHHRKRCVVFLLQHLNVFLTFLELRSFKEKSTALITEIHYSNMCMFN